MIFCCKSAATGAASDLASAAPKNNNRERRASTPSTHLACQTLLRSAPWLLSNYRRVHFLHLAAPAQPQPRRHTNECRARRRGCRIACTPTSFKSLVLPPARCGSKCCYEWIWVKNELTRQVQPLENQLAVHKYLLSQAPTCYRQQS